MPAPALVLQTACPVDAVELLLVHDMASSSRYWGANLGPLGARFRVAAPDLLGLGASPKPAENAYSPADHAAALARVVAHAGTPVVVVGHSLGALLALHLAVLYPQLVRGVVLISLPFFATAAEAREQLSSGSAIARLQLEHPQLAHAFCWGMCHMRPLTRAMMPLLERDVPAEVARAAVDHTWRSASRTVTGVIVGTRPALLLDALPADRLLFLHAADDRTAPLDHVAAYAQARPAARLVTFADGGHHPYLRHPTGVCAAIATFVDTLPSIALTDQEAAAGLRRGRYHR